MAEMRQMITRYVDIRSLVAWCEWEKNMEVRYLVWTTPLVSLTFFWRVDPIVETVCSAQRG